MRRDVLFVYIVTLALLPVILLTSEHYATTCPTSPPPPPTIAGFVIIPAATIFTLSVIMAVVAYRSLKVAPPEVAERVEALFHFLTLWAFLAFICLLGWIHYVVSGDPYCSLALDGVKIYTFYFENTYFFVVLAGVEYMLLKLSESIRRERYAALSTLMLVLFIAQAIVSLLPWEYCPFNVPPESFFARPTAYILAGIMIVISCSPGAVAALRRASVAPSKEIRKRMRLVSLGFIFAMVFAIFLMFFCIMLMIGARTLADIFLSIAGLGAFFSPIFFFLGIVWPLR